MDEVRLKQLTRQLKLLNIWISIFGVLFLAGFVVMGIFIYKVVTLTDNVSNKFDNLQQKTEQTLDLQKQICQTKTAATLLQKATDICN
jgi:predicted PurR-regulated permease PerM